MKGNTGEPLVIFVGPRRSTTGGVDEPRGHKEPPGLTADQQAAIRAAAPATAVVHFFDDQRDVEKRISQADIVAGSVYPSAFSRAHRLKWIHSWKAGPNDLMYPALLESDVIMTSSSGNGAIPLAEHALMFMLMLNRGMPRWWENQRAHRWERRRHGELTGLTCGIIGLGNIGLNLARMLAPHAMRVIGMRRRAEPAEFVDEIYPSERLLDFLAASDFVVLTAPLTPESEGMLGEREFRSMKRSAFYISLSRGGIADDAALLRALEEGWIAGAGLDAHGVEPLPPESPFWDAPNTIVTPHNGGTTPLLLNRSVEIFIENLQRYARRDELVNVIDKQAGY